MDVANAPNTLTPTHSDDKESTVCLHDMLNSIISSYVNEALEADNLPDVATSSSSVALKCLNDDFNFTDENAEADYLPEVVTADTSHTLIPLACSDGNEKANSNTSSTKSLDEALEADNLPSMAASNTSNNTLKLKCKLLTHQVEALQWMISREDMEPRGGILADDMGLGKTLTFLSLVLAKKKIQNTHIKKGQQNRNGGL